MQRAARDDCIRAAQLRNLVSARTTTQPIDSKPFEDRLNVIASHGGLIFFQMGTPIIDILRAHLAELHKKGEKRRQVIHQPPVHEDGPALMHR